MSTTSCPRWRVFGTRKAWMASITREKIYSIGSRSYACRISSPEWTSTGPLPKLQRKKQDFSKVEFLTVDEGLCVQAMHVGPYDDEPATVASMDQFTRENGWVNDFTETRQHHEIYLSDARKVEPARWKTVIRHPVCRLQAGS
jgi:hypothetical protein